MPQTERVNLTQRSIDAAPTPGAGRTVVWDQTTRGLGLMIQRTGTKSFFWARRVRGKLEWHTIGSTDDFKLEEARTRADDINSQVGKWKEAGALGPVPVAKPPKTGSFGQLFDDYCTFYVPQEAKNPPKALEQIRWLFKAYISSLRDRELSLITRDELRKLHKDLGEKHGKVSANRAMQLVKRIINWGIDAERYDGGNVALKVDMFAEKSRKRIAEKSELERIFAELTPEKEPSADLRDFVWLALTTGARKSDILSMRWADLALPDRRWTVPFTTKSGDPYDIPLSPEAIAILRKREKSRTDSEWVFASRGVSGHIVDLKCAWKNLLDRAQVKNLTQHDLRRTAGTNLLNEGASITVIGKYLGHAAGSSATSVYARPSLELVDGYSRASSKKLKALAAPRKKSFR